MTYTKLMSAGAAAAAKTTLLPYLRVTRCSLDKGTIKRADGLRVVMFDRNREQLDQNKNTEERRCVPAEEFRDLPRSAIAVL